MRAIETLNQSLEGLNRMTVKVRGWISIFFRSVNKCTVTMTMTVTVTVTVTMTVTMTVTVTVTVTVKSSF